MRFAGRVPDGIDDDEKVTAQIDPIDTRKPQKHRSEFIIVAEIPAKTRNSTPAQTSPMISDTNLFDQPS